MPRSSCGGGWQRSKSQSIRTTCTEWCWDIVCLLMSCFNNSIFRFREHVLNIQHTKNSCHERQQQNPQQLFFCCSNSNNKKPTKLQSSIPRSRYSFTREKEEAWSLLVSLRIDCCAFQDVSFHALRQESLWRTSSCAIAAWVSPPQESRSHRLTYPNCRGSCRSPQKRREFPLSARWRQQQVLFSLLSPPFRHTKQLCLCILFVPTGKFSL